MRITLGLRTGLSILLTLVSLPPLRAQTSASPNPKTVPVIDGGIGPCTADFAITDNAGAPIYDADIKVHIAYGIFGAHKLDLEVGTNADGKARFTGLPSKTKEGLFFQVSKADRKGSAFDDTAKTCQAQFAVVLEEQKPTTQARVRSAIILADLNLVDLNLVDPVLVDPVPEVGEPRIAPAVNLLWHPRLPSPMIIPISMRKET